MQIQLTTKYTIFKKMVGNRPIEKRHVNALKVQIAKYPTLTQVLPILVNDDLEVVDGQHRLEALRELGMPVYYIKAEGAGLADVIAINESQKTWTWLDYANSYANMKNENYITYLEFLKEYPNVGHKALILGLSNFVYGTADYLRFKKGQFTVTGDLTAARAFLSLIEFMHRHAGVTRSIYFTRAFGTMYQEPMFENETYRSQLLKWGYLLHPTGTVVDAEKQLRGVYNKDLPQDQRI